jgi:hypothetical protein
LRAAKGKIRDKDLVERKYTATVTIADMPPTATPEWEVRGE